MIDHLEFLSLFECSSSAIQFLRNRKYEFCALMFSFVLFPQMVRLPVHVLKH